MASSFVLDNLAEESQMLHALAQSLKKAHRADVCVGYFHLRGWLSLSEHLQHFTGGEGEQCRVIVGMNRPPDAEMRRLQRSRPDDDTPDGPEMARRRTRAIEDFKEQLSIGVPSKQAEQSLRQLARDLRTERVRVSLYLRHQLHAKLYLTHRRDEPDTPRVAYVGSSNLSYSGLRGNGELNVRVNEQLSSHHLATWFEDRWAMATDISDELLHLIETSWAREKVTQPYHVYLRIAYELSEDARAGARDLKIPARLNDLLLDYQKPAVLHAAYHLNRRGGAILGDVVGLGKTITAIATASLLQETGGRTLIVCPPKLVAMWKAETERLGLYAEVLSHGELPTALPNKGTWQTLIVDESHNFRNGEGKRYSALKKYIDDHSPRVLLLSATPYNKQFEDLAAQLRLFVDDGQDLRIRPERLLKEWRDRGKDERAFEFQMQASPRSLKAFEKSTFPDDWKDLLRLFLVRRTRSFILKNHAAFDPKRERYFVEVQDTRMYFPTRRPHTVAFELDPVADPYARLLRPEVVDTIGTLYLPRYGLTLYLQHKYNPDKWTAKKGPPKELNEKQVLLLKRLTRSGKRLIGVTRTGLFKRLESSGESFLLSIERHILRNLVYVYAIDHGLDLPLGGVDVAMLDAALMDDDEALFADERIVEQTDESAPDLLERLRLRSKDAYQAAKASGRVKNWLPSAFFGPNFRLRLLDDAEALARVLRDAGRWEASKDAKFAALYRLLTDTHGQDKVLVFTQFADTARYLARELQSRGVTRVGLATADADDPTDLARRFSPVSNRRGSASTALRPGEEELRVLVATDVLSEGQNLQDAHVVVNYDLPWAIIRLIQRAGRVDRIGQQHDTIDAYSFLPAGGVEQIIGLRTRLAERLKMNQEVIGTDEAFFGDEDASALRDLYAERDGSLDEDEAEDDVDLASAALQVWNSATDKDRRAALDLPPIVSAARSANLPGRTEQAESVVTYLQYPDGSDALLRIAPGGRVLSASLGITFRAIACSPETPALPLATYHYDRVAQAVEMTAAEHTTAGALGSLREIRRRVYDRLDKHKAVLKGQATLFDPEGLADLDRALHALYAGPLRGLARETLGRALANGLPNDGLVRLVLELYEKGTLTDAVAPVEAPEPRVVCALGLV